MSASGARTTFLGVDVGTGSTKGVLVDGSGTVLATAVRPHTVSRPHPGHVEMDADVWWDEFVSITRELGAEGVSAVGVSGMGPCVALANSCDEPVRPAILYGVDTRATEQIARLTTELGRDDVLERCGSLLSTQAVGPKIAWVAEHEPEVAARARRLYMPASFLAQRLTGAYVLDHHSASQSVPLYDSVAQAWYRPWCDLVAPGIELPELRWPGDVAGPVTAEAAAATGLPVGVPVITGTIDAWTESISVGATGVGDLMLMYGTTMFLVATTAQRLLVPELWSTVGAFPGTRNLAGGMATSGAVTEWLRTLVGSPEHAELQAEAEASGTGARGLLMLPYFAGERTPIADPDARGVVAGLTVSHTRGDLYRAALEATAFGVRHNVEAMRDAGAGVHRVVAVGGGTTSALWPQIVTDVTGLEQHIPTVTIGASYGAAHLAARAVGEADIAAWNPVREVRTPDPAVTARYDELFDLYTQLHPATRDIVHALARTQV
ncbi:MULTISPECIES: FGGY-family carbohydrate kinase [unclassified Pseudonocardia]|uniref:FGGY-family carbohydrate kinase n=1 Tax=unclassified Pseudonocardia TaxID=2619320 RepID=UPI00095CA630|nr:MULTISPECIES: FGGY-family carbohydrate kinase [unclassified Pseudonocardia]MBN9101722.1 FGGY-family carbohydrate kinase [Pseudonocardia sp.]OJY50181.1 MAG: sugar kinase [Pseudonocardia sp. 73-21]